MPSRPSTASPSTASALGPGHTLDQRFLLTEVINRGGMATIFKAEDLHNHHQPVAVKMPHAMFATGFGSTSRFQREDDIGHKLNHPYILKFIPVERKNHRSYIVTEHLLGQTLGDLLAGKRPLPEKDALRYASLICEAVQYLHEQGVVHYDLKPNNVMLCIDGSIRLIDFGLAHPVDGARFALRSQAAGMGTADYISPEQIKRRPGRTSADIYALGAILCEMLTGTVPFPGDDPFVVGSVRLTGDPVAPRKLNPKVSPQAEEIALRALRRDPSERYPTAAAMKADLDASEQVHVTGLWSRLQPSTPWKRALRRARYVAITSLLPIAIQVGLYAFIWWHFRGKR